MQSLAPASSLAEPPPAASPQLGRWICQLGFAIRENPWSAAGACCCQSAAADVLMLLCCFGDDCSSLAFFRSFKFRTGIIFLELATTASTVSIFYLCMQSPAPASSLAEPPPAASPQLGRWICQLGFAIRENPWSAAGACCCQCCCCCCVDDDCPCQFVRLVTFRTGMTLRGTVTALAGTGFASHYMPWFE